jgi:hypothetical protein
MKSISKLIEELDTSELDAVMDSPEFKAQGEYLTQLIKSNPFDLELVDKEVL